MRDWRLVIEAALPNIIVITALGQSRSICSFRWYLCFATYQEGIEVGAALPLGYDCYRLDLCALRN